MPRRKKERGQPAGNRPPPRIDATPEQIAQAMFRLPANHQWRFEQDGGAEYRCAACHREVYYPETLYNDGRCEKCHAAG